MFSSPDEPNCSPGTVATYMFFWLRNDDWNVFRRSEVQENQAQAADQQEAAFKVGIKRSSLSVWLNLD